MRRRRLGQYADYWVFPIAGILASLLIPYEKIALRILIGIVFSGLGVIAADSGFRFGDLRALPSQLRGRVSAVERSRTASLFMAAALILMIFSAWAFSPGVNVERIFTLPVILMLLGTAAVWIAVRAAPPRVEIISQTTAPVQPERSRLPLAFLGVLSLLIAGEIAGNALAIPQFQRVPLLTQALFFYGGIALLVLGLGGVDVGAWLARRSTAAAGATDSPVGTHPAVVTDTTVEQKRSWWAQHRAETAVVILLFLAAFFVRAWNLERGLPVSVDEALAVDGTVHYFGGAIGLVARPSEFITTLLFPQAQSEIVRVLGRSVTSLRLFSTIAGALTVVVTYFLTRELFRDKRLALIAGLLLLALPPHIHFSRIALLHVADPLTGTLAIWFLVRGLRYNRRTDWALAGVMLGLTQYFFEAGRLFYIPMVVVWLILSLIIRFLPRRRSSAAADAPARGQIAWRGVFIAVIALIMVAMPTYYAAFSRGGNATPRLTASGGFNLLIDPFQDGLTGEEAAQLARRLLFPFTVYVTQPEQAVFYGGDQPLMLVYVVPFFLMGVAYMLLRWRTPAGILLLWLLLTGATNALLRDSAVYARWHVVFPAVAVVTAVGIRYLLPILWTRPTADLAAAAASVSEVKPRRWLLRPLRPTVAWVIVGVIAVLLVGQVTYYYQFHAPLMARQAREFKYYPDVFDAGLRMKDLPNNTDIYLISDPIPDINVPRIWNTFLTRGDVSTLNYYPLAATDFTQEFAYSLPDKRNLALYVDVQATTVILTMVNTFGCEIQNSPYPIDPPTKEFVLCYVPVGTPRTPDLPIG